jgi:transposase-like protein
MTCPKCQSQMRPLEWTYERNGEQKPLCNGWACRCGETVLDRTPRQPGEFAEIVREWEAK